MNEYEIIYDFDEGDGYINRNLTTHFCGTWLELQKHIKRMRENGAYNIDVTLLNQD